MKEHPTAHILYRQDILQAVNAARFEGVEWAEGRAEQRGRDHARNRRWVGMQRFCVLHGGTLPQNRNRGHSTMDLETQPPQSLDRHRRGDRHSPPLVSKTNPRSLRETRRILYVTEQSFSCALLL